MNLILPTIKYEGYHTNDVGNELKKKWQLPYLMDKLTGFSIAVLDFIYQCSLSHPDITNQKRGSQRRCKGRNKLWYAFFSSSPSCYPHLKVVDFAPKTHVFGFLSHHFFCLYPPLCFLSFLVV